MASAAAASSPAVTPQTLAPFPHPVGLWQNRRVEIAVWCAYAVFVFLWLPLCFNWRVYKKLGWAHAMAATYPFLRRVIAKVTSRTAEQMEGAIEDCSRPRPARLLALEAVRKSLTEEELRAVMVARREALLRDAAEIRKEREEMEAQRQGAPSVTKEDDDDASADDGTLPPTMVLIAKMPHTSPHPRIVELADEAVDDDKVMCAPPPANAAAESKHVTFDMDEDEPEEGTVAPSPPPIDITLIASRAVEERRKRSLGVATASLQQ